VFPLPRVPAAVLGHVDDFVGVGHSS
jgi:hypothetical protein